MPLAEARQRIPATVAELESAEGRTLMHGFADDLAWVASLLAGLRCPLVALHPPELQRELLALAEHIQTIAAQPAQEEGHLGDLAHLAAPNAGRRQAGCAWPRS